MSSTTTVSVITQVNEKIPLQSILNKKKSSKRHHLSQILTLSIRGQLTDIDRSLLLSLPESILIVMFPQGLSLETNQCHEVDFNAECLHYLLDYFKQTKNGEDVYLAHANASNLPLYPILSKQAVIMLREELEYFVLSNASSVSTLVKQKSSEWLLKQDLVFKALLENMDNKKGAAEHHLVDILCAAGFSRQDHWSFRAMEPNKTLVQSLSLVTLSQQQRVKIGQMLFWRKPARKCWWMNKVVKIDKQNVKLWCRRTWTLELVLL